MTAFTIIHTPRHSANDEWGEVVAVHVCDGEPVVAGQALLEVEESKAIVEVTAPVAGMAHPLVAAGTRLPVGSPLLLLADRKLEPAEIEAAVGYADSFAARFTNASATTGVHDTRFSIQALELISVHGLDPAGFAGQGLVDRAAVLRAISRQTGAPDPAAAEDVRRGSNGRIALCGAGPGAYQLLSVLLGEAGTTVVGLLDDDPAKWGLEIYGVATLGPLSLVGEMAQADKLDAIVCTTPTSITFRQKVHAIGNQAGVRLANIIHPTAQFDRGVRMGGGNFFGAFCYVGAETTIGHYGFFSSRTTLEHHNRVGDGVTTGPGVTTSGRVTIGNHVKFGTGVHVEPNLTIGDNATLASGLAITADVAAGRTVKARGRQS